MDDDKDGYLRRRGLWRFFRSFLCGLLVLTGSGCQSPPYTAARLADPAALWISTAVLKFIADQSGNSNDSDDSTSITGVSFDNLADWYSIMGFQLSPWLELLDLSKWQYLVNSDNNK